MYAARTGERKHRVLIACGGLVAWWWWWLGCGELLSVACIERVFGIWRVGKHSTLSLYLCIYVLCVFIYLISCAKLLSLRKRGLGEWVMGCELERILQTLCDTRRRTPELNVNTHRRIYAMPYRLFTRHTTYTAAACRFCTH